jgi:hypothetical protein
MSNFVFSAYVVLNKAPGIGYGWQLNPQSYHP